MIDWEKVGPELIADVARDCLSNTELAAALSERSGERVTERALSSRWWRLKRRDGTLPKLRELLRQNEVHVRRELRASDNKFGRTHCVIPDTQVKPNVPLEHFVWLGRYIADKQPDVIVHLGDHWDMPSLSTYDSTAKKAWERRHKLSDIEAGNQALEMLEEEFAKANYQPQLKVLLEGNHDGFASEGRIGRYLADCPEDGGLITPDMFADKCLDWKRVPFLEQIEIDGVLYAHLFPFTARGRISRSGLRTGSASAASQVLAVMQSATAGHKQGLDIHVHPSQPYRGIIAGSFYLHNEEYMGPANSHWRGVLMKYEVDPVNHPNHYDLSEISLSYLKRRYA